MPKTLIEYDLEQSCFYKLSNPNRLASLLGCKLADIERVIKIGLKNYRSFPVRKGAKNRLINEPNKKLKSIQKRIHELFSRIRVPDYLTSKKGSFYLNNAQEHLEGCHFLKMDVKDFFPSTNKEYLFKFLRYEMKMSEKCSWIIVDLVTYKSYLPTGCPSSQILAYFSYKNMFDSIYQLAIDNDVRFTLFVDDLSFSSKTFIPDSFRRSIARIFKQYSLEVKKEKVMYFGPRSNKTITGCLLTRDKRILASNKRKRSIREMWIKWNELKKSLGGLDNALKDKVYRSMCKSLAGKIQSVRQVEAHSFSHWYASVKSIEVKVRRFEREQIFSLHNKGYSPVSISRVLGLKKKSVELVANRISCGQKSMVIPD
jgi:hypothetical protein